MRSIAFYLLPVHEPGLREIAKECGLELSYYPSVSAGGASRMAQFSGDSEGFADLGQRLWLKIGPIPDELHEQLRSLKVWEPVR
ncbi:hypothetical protein [Methylorubrum extorquens]